jgi:hypothetical protein
LGPPAPDTDLCRDVIGRLCLTPLCADTTRILGVTEGTCVEALTRQTRCGNDAFLFTTPSRDRLLECRAPLVKNSGLRTANPACEDVTSMLNNCPDLVAFLKGG